MDNFPLLDLHPTFLEKVINQLDSDESGVLYYRLQQTCRAMNEFIHNSPNISVYFDADFTLRWDASTSTCKFTLGPDVTVDGKDLHGTRLRSLVNDENDDLKHSIPPICEILKKNRITCKRLYIDDGSWTKEQYGQLLKLVKPIAVGLDSAGSNKFEALLLSKTIYDVNIHLNEADVDIALPELISNFELINFYVTDNKEPFGIVRTALQLILSGAVSRRLQLTFSAMCGYRPTVDEVKEKLSDCTFAINTNSHVTLAVTLKLPQNFPRQLCQITFQQNNTVYFDYCGLNKMSL